MEVTLTDPRASTARYSMVAAELVEGYTEDDYTVVSFTHLEVSAK